MIIINGTTATEGHKFLSDTLGRDKRPQSDRHLLREGCSDSVTGSNGLLMFPGMFYMGSTGYYIPSYLFRFTTEENKDMNNRWSVRRFNASE